MARKKIDQNPPIKITYEQESKTAKVDDIDFKLDEIIE